MAEQNKQQSKTSGAGDKPRTITTEPDDFGDSEPTSSPLSQILSDLERVAEGGSMAPLRQRITGLMPEDRAYGEALIDTLRRLRSAAEAAFNYAQEEHWAKHRPR